MPNLEVVAKGSERTAADAPPADDGSAKAAALQHARECWKLHTETRNKHFHYFILVFSVSMLAAASGKVDWQLVGIVGIFVSMLFSVLDWRGRQLTEDAKEDMARLEPQFGLKVHSRDSEPLRKSRRSLVSTTTVYQTIFLLTWIYSVAQAFRIVRSL
ncbi:MAG TPA: hypothetical protein VJ890_10150 [Vineibacter sp.]|nr:hypothetical protein [Vineibacter sp.]